ncbi:anhydro-N-acetylmuramic acid kinase [Dokdonella sp.]|uniref:anhydro-N-acetylmuramic acid kinase n=1 Tax=Dokdonella sp. TaxID=2291710 RepID=UPI003C5FB57D
MSSLFLGLISGTSTDGIDAALVRFDGGIEVIAARTSPYPAELRQKLLALTEPDAAILLDHLGALDVEIGECFAAAALDLLADAGTPASAVQAIGSHGQTIRHRPDGNHPFSMQIGDAAVIAERTGICTVADFRRADVAAGGQGAPLAPAFHAAALSNHLPCAVLNLGGIANLSLLGKHMEVLGFDTGPANCLLDAWNMRHRGTSCDLNGEWATSGTVDLALLEVLLDARYFRIQPPKSTGREVFNLDWLDKRLGDQDRKPVDVQATLMALTTRTVADALSASAFKPARVLVCGGGVHNLGLMSALATAISPIPLDSTASVGLDPDFVEAALLAWLARERLAGRSSNLPSVTGARGQRHLGAVFAAPP